MTVLTRRDTKAARRAWRCPGGYSVSEIVKIQGFLLPCCCGATQGNYCKTPTARNRRASEQFDEKIRLGADMEKP